MTNSSSDMPPPEHWPVVTPPDCPLCQRHTDVAWIGPATYRDGTDVNAWHCHGCRHDWHIPVTRWSVDDGPDCPTCLTAVTGWAAMDPDRRGDRWICRNGHEFVLTDEGLVIVPDNEDLSDWAPVWPPSRRDRPSSGE